MKAPTSTATGFSRRERQIMDIVYALGVATAAEVHARMTDAPTYTTVRGLLRVLVRKGHLRVRNDGVRFVYRPATPSKAAGASVLRHVLHTFFDDSPAKAVAAILDSSDLELTPAELERLSRMVREARARGKE